jgi:putative phosphoribosyl transferase
MLTPPHPNNAVEAEPRDGERSLAIIAGAVRLEGELSIQHGARGLVLFALGSSHRNPRDRFVARALQRHGFGTLLFEPLTHAERRLDAADERLRFDVRLLAQRLVLVADWARSHPLTGGLPVAYFGVGMGAAAALVAAAERPELVRAVVCRGGRPDLAGAALARVRAPSLLLPPGGDPIALERGERARQQLPASARLALLPGNARAFEDAASLSLAADLAAAWYTANLTRVGATDSRAPS